MASFHGEVVDLQCVATSQNKAVSDTEFVEHSVNLIYFPLYRKLKFCSTTAVRGLTNVNYGF